jgi:hypothetical protein
MIKKINLEVLCQKGVAHSMKLRNDVALSLAMPFVTSLGRTSEASQA